MDISGNWHTSCRTHTLHMERVGRGSQRKERRIAPNVQKRPYGGEMIHVEELP